MAEPEPEGWAVPMVKPLAAAGATLGMLLAMLTLAGWVYHKHLQSHRFQPLATFPAPGVETFIHDGTRDVDRPPPPPRADADLEQAKRAVVAGGIPGWESQR